ncbi:hypothetical protein I7I53_00256 [Histoplasma capsulatum var. duboisii H88]|uniref:Uncharacterized protein n=1 Tax=Ajellomyces capsulatus (strain H88) TaxID=544711 RepID=A0A8A1LGB2_AJEC8|nr:hypothetical protein I7I53_00256 [Histoplasma capsulatum var. duboisii H88]
MAAPCYYQADCFNNTSYDLTQSEVERFFYESVGFRTDRFKLLLFQGGYGYQHYVVISHRITGHCISANAWTDIVVHLYTLMKTPNFNMINPWFMHRSFISGIKSMINII